MKKYNLKDLVKNKTAVFYCYKDGALWYRIDDFDFPIPIEETKGGTFLVQHKAIRLMRWVRKHLQTIAKEQAKNKCDGCDGKGKVYFPINGIDWHECNLCEGLGYLTNEKGDDNDGSS